MKIYILLVTILMLNSCSAQEHKEYYVNGKLKGIGKLNKDSIPVGKWKMYDENEKLTWLIQYTNKGIATGEWKEYYENGKIKTIENYQNAQKTGEWKKYHENGLLYKIGMYENDEEIGEWKFFNKDEKLVEIKNYKEGKATGKWETYLKNGTVETITNYENGKKTGKWKKYWNETLISIGTYKNDEKTGEWKYYWSNGTLDNTAYYTKGEKTGEWKKYHSNGQIEEIGKYKHKKIGEWKKYYNNGKIREIGKYDYGKEIGKWKLYDEQGKLIETKNYNKISKSRINPSKLKLDSIVASFEKPVVYLAISPNIRAGLRVYINNIKISPKEFEFGNYNMKTSSPVSHYLKPNKNKLSFVAWSKYSNIIEEEAHLYDVGIELLVRDEVQGRNSEVIINKTSLSILDCEKVGSSSSAGVQSKDIIAKVLSGYLNKNKSMNIEKTQLSTEIINDYIVWTVSYEFTWHSKLLAPKWATSETIKDNEKTHREVFKAYEKIHKTLQNKDYAGWLKLNDEKYDETAKLTFIPLENIIRYDPFIKSLNQILNNQDKVEKYTLKPLDFNNSSMEIVADGKLVRLHNKNGKSIIWYTLKRDKSLGLDIDFYLRKQGDEWVISRNMK